METPAVGERGSHRLAGKIKEHNDDSSSTRSQQEMGPPIPST